MRFLKTVASVAVPYPRVYAGYALAVAVALGGIWLLSTRQFEATALISVNHGISDADRSQVRNVSAEEASRAQVVLLTGADVVRSALVDLKRTAESADPEAVENVQEKLSARIVPLTGLIRISFLDSDPAFASAFVERIVENYKVKFERAYEGNNTAKFLADRLKSRSEELDQARDQLVKFKQESHVHNFDEQQRLLMRQRVDLSDSIMATTDRIASIRAKQEVLPKQLATLLSGRQTDDSNGASTGLPSADNDADKISRLSRASSTLTMSVYEENLTLLIKLRAQMEGLASNEAAQRSSLAALDVELAALQNQQAEYLKIAQAVTQAENDVRLLTVKLAEANVADGLRTSRLANVRVVQRPVSSAAPVWPTVPFLAGMGLCLLAFPVAAGSLRSAIVFQNSHPNGPVFPEAPGLRSPSTIASPLQRSRQIELGIQSLVVLLAISCTTALSPELLPVQVQQVFAVAGWSGIIFLSYFVPRPSTFAPTPALIAFVSFFVFAIASSLWSPEPLPSVMKAIVLGLTTFGAYRLVAALDTQQIVDSLVLGLTIVLMLCVVAVVAAPGIGITHGWMHEGMWRGLFGSKQGLGIVSGILLFLSGYLLVSRPIAASSLFAFFLAALCVYGSGSRGGAAMSLAVVLLLFICRNSSIAARAAVWLPLSLITVSFCGSMYLLSTGEEAFFIHGHVIDFTERTAIWQHSLTHWWNDAFWFGHGLNGFWTSIDVQGQFFDTHGWALDDYHSGYMAVLGDTGIVGFSLFVLANILFAARLRWLLINDQGNTDRYIFIACLLSVLFLISLTETVLLRSTSTMTSLVTMLFLTGLKTTNVEGRPLVSNS